MKTRVKDDNATAIVNLLGEIRTQLSIMNDNSINPLRRLTEIRDLVIANVKTDTNGASMAEPAPSAYDVAKTITMLLSEGTLFDPSRVGHDNMGKDAAGFEFIYNSHRYTVGVERF